MVIGHASVSVLPTQLAKRSLSQRNGQEYGQLYLGCIKLPRTKAEGWESRTCPQP